MTGTSSKGHKGRGHPALKGRKVLIRCLILWEQSERLRKLRKRRDIDRSDMIREALDMWETRENAMCRDCLGECSIIVDCERAA